MGNIKMTRKELYDLVWSTPMTKLAKKYLISDTGLRKICKTMNIPLPKAGHWEKLKVGKKVIVEKLPTDSLCKQEANLELRQEGDESIKGKPSPEILLREKIEQDPSLNLIVPDKLTKPHKLVIEAKQALYNNENRFSKSFVYYQRSPLRISVTKSHIGRALRIMDTFIKAMEQRGHEFQIRNETVHIVICEEEFSMNLREKNKRVPKPKTSSWQEYDYIPTGILAFSVRISYNDTEWKDAKLPLEQQLSKIIAKLEIKGAEEREETLRWEKERKIREDKQRIIKEKEQKVAEELVKFKELKQNAEHWDEANRIRAYVKEIEKKATSKKSMTKELRDWINWAKKKADWHDPTMEYDNELLSETNKKI